MIINHPLLGPRDSEEFVYLGRRILSIDLQIGEKVLPPKTSISINILEKILPATFKSFGTTNKVINHG